MELSGVLGVIWGAGTAVSRNCSITRIVLVLTKRKVDGVAKVVGAVCRGSRGKRSIIRSRSSQGIRGST